MLPVLNFYCHGYVAIRILESCKERGLFELLDIQTSHDTAWLTAELKANAGYFAIALRALESLERV